mgnify:CR=1 FL=1
MAKSIPAYIRIASQNKKETMKINYKDFEDFLMWQFSQENPQILDDDSIDAFNDWVCELDVEDWFKYADKYANEYHRIMVERNK